MDSPTWCPTAPLAPTFELHSTQVVGYVCKLPVLQFIGLCPKLELNGDSEQLREQFPGIGRAYLIGCDGNGSVDANLPHTFDAAGGKGTVWISSGFTSRNYTPPRKYSKPPDGEHRMHSSLGGGQFVHLVVATTPTGLFVTDLSQSKRLAPAPAASLLAVPSY